MTSASYAVAFERIGRHHNVEPMMFEDVTEPEELAALIHQRVRPHLGSKFYEVIVDLEEMEGRILAGGWRSAGTFTIKEEGADA